MQANRNKEAEKAEEGRRQEAAARRQQLSQGGAGRTAATQQQPNSGMTGVGRTAATQQQPSSRSTGAQQLLNSRAPTTQQLPASRPTAVQQPASLKRSAVASPGQSPASKASANVRKKMRAGHESILADIHSQATSLQMKLKDINFEQVFGEPDSDGADVLRGGGQVDNSHGQPVQVRA